MPLVELLLENGASLSEQDCHGRTALFCAAQSNLHSCHVLKALLRRATPALVNMRYETYSIYIKNDRIVITYYYMLTRACDGASAVMLAAQTGCFECLQILIDNGGDANLKAHDGVMAVHLALTGNHQK